MFGALIILLDYLRKIMKILDQYSIKLPYKTKVFKYTT
jgi:hypothetical protein